MEINMIDAAKKAYIKTNNITNNPNSTCSMPHLRAWLRIDNTLVEPEETNTAISMSPSVDSPTRSDIDNITHKNIMRIIVENRDEFRRLQMRIRVSPAITDSAVREITEQIVQEKMKEQKVLRESFKKAQVKAMPQVPDDDKSIEAKKDFWGICQMSMSSIYASFTEQDNMTDIYSEDPKENLYELQEMKYSETEKQTASPIMIKAKKNIKAARGA